MTHSSTHTAYEARLRRVIQHIFDNPAGDLSLDALADVAAMSRFHWHRVFVAMTGETCAQAVRRVRAHRAAHWLVHTDWPLAKISKQAGYDNEQSFARLFRREYGMTPLAFRAAGHAAPERLHLQKGKDTMYPTEIRTLPTQHLAGLAHTGPYQDVGNAFQQVSAVFSARGLWPQARGMAGVYYDSPDEVPPAELRSHAGVLVGEDFDMPDALEGVTFPAGRYLVLTLKGPYTGLADAWNHAYSKALPDTGAEPANVPPFEIYLNDPTDTKPEDLLTEICVPLAE